MSLDAQYFADLYAGSDAPWAFRTRWYERRKRDLASLPRQCYERIFEAACANGELSLLLAERCADRLCQDIDATAVVLARQRLAGVGHAYVEQGHLPGDWLGGQFDLVLSEIGYYLNPTDWLQVIEQSVASLAYDGGLLACHWRHPIAGCPQDGREVHALLARHLSLYPLLRHEEADFLLEYLVMSAQCRRPRRDLPMIAVIIPAHTEARRLGHCLTAVKQAVAQAETAGIAIEVLVVLDRCVDASARIARRLGVHTLELEAGNVGIARRLGAAWMIERGAQ